MSYTTETENSTFSGTVTESVPWAEYVIPVNYNDTVNVSLSATNIEDIEFTETYISSSYLSTYNVGVQAAYFEYDTFDTPTSVPEHFVTTLSAANGGAGGSPAGFLQPGGTQQYVTSGSGYLVIAVYGYDDPLTQSFTITLSQGGSSPPPGGGSPPPGGGSPPPPPAPKLVVTAANLDGSSSAATVAAGGSVTLNFTVTNEGTGAAAAATFGVYLNTSSAFGSAGTLEASYATIPLAAGQPDPLTENLTIPANTAPGTYYIEEEDNPFGPWSEPSFTQPLTVTAAAADVLVENVSITPNQIVQNGSATLNFSVVNTGSITSAASTVSVYVFPEGASSGAAAFTINNIPALAPGGSQPESQPETFTQAPGTYDVELVDSLSGQQTNAFTTLTIIGDTISSSSTEGEDGTQGQSNTITFNVELSAPLSVAATVQYATQDGTAKAGVNYNATSGTLTFQPGETSLPVNVTTIGTNTPVGTTEFDLVLSNPTKATLPNDASTQPYTGTIIDVNTPGTIPSQLPADDQWQTDSNDDDPGHYEEESSPTFTEEPDGTVEAPDDLTWSNLTGFLQSMAQEGETKLYNVFQQLSNSVQNNQYYQLAKQLWTEYNQATSQPKSLTTIFKNWINSEFNNFENAVLGNQTPTQTYTNDNNNTQTMIDDTNQTMTSTNKNWGPAQQQQLNNTSYSLQTNQAPSNLGEGSADDLAEVLADATTASTTMQFNMYFNNNTATPPAIVAQSNLYFIFSGGADNEIVHGGNVGNQMYAGSGNDTFYAGTGNDTLYAGTGIGTFYVGSGHDTLIGNTGTSTAVYSGPRADYSIGPESGGAVQISDLRSGAPNGVSTATNITYFQFADRTLTLEEVADLTAPSLTTDKVLQVGIGHAVPITASLLRFTDNVSTDAQEAYTITSAPSHGTVLKNGAAVSTFTQADIDNGLITYQENGSAATADAFSFTVTDISGNTTATQQFSIQMLPLAQMMMRNTSSDALELYDINNNQIAPFSMGQIGLDWSVAGIGDFSSNPDEADMLMRNTNSGAFYLYDISNGQYSGFFSFGQVGTGWAVEGFGDFSSKPNETDMLMRNTTSGAFELYDISSNQYSGFYTFGQVGPDWSVVGFGDFSGNANETDMLMRNSTGLFEVYDIANNRIYNAQTFGQVGPEWSVAGFGDFSGNANETDMLMRNAAGAFELYDISNNRIYNAQSFGQVGQPWQVVGIGDFTGNVNESDLLMRNAATGAFQLYDISQNAYTNYPGMGQVGLAWSVAGLSIDGPAGSLASTMAPLLINDGTLSAGVGLNTIIGASLLQFADNFSGDAQETYTLTGGPSHGVLLRNGVAVTSFTQSDIDNGLIAYHPTGAAMSDAFSFTVTDAAGNTTPAESFQISLSDKSAPALTHDGPVNVIAGFSTPITPSLLQFDDNVSTHVQETYTITAGPSHGTVLKNGVAVTSFTQADIDSGAISYSESGAIVGSDSLSFTVMDSAGNLTPSETLQFNLVVLPPAATHNVAVNVGIGRVVAITSSQLQFDDNVYGHAQETYTITAGPADGAVLKNGTPVTTFTQADIDNGLITYQENGAVAASDSFAFTVTDASGSKTAIQRFSVAVTPPAELFMRDTITGDVELYGMTNNQYTGFYSLGQVGTEWTIVGIGDFSGKAGESDMLMQNTSSGAFQLFDISNYQYSGFPTLGQVGQPWQVAGLGDFSGRANEADMLMRNATTGAFELYDISNNAYSGFITLGQVGPEWSVVGFGDFSGNANEADMLMRNATGAFEVYDIANSQLYNAHSMGQVGPEWSVVGFGDFSGNANETDMLMRNAAGAFEVYDITGNSIYNAQSMGQVGPEWSTVGFGDFSGNANETDMLMRNTAGTFEVYDIANNQIYNAHSMGQIGTEWVVGGVAANMPNASGALTAQLAQAMSSFTLGDSTSTTGNSQATDQQSAQLSPTLITQPAVA